VQKLREALEARLAAAARMRPIWAATAPRLVEILLAHPGDVETVRRCCQQLSQQIAVIGGANQTAVAAVGGIEAVVAALRAHPSVEAVQRSGCLALSSLVDGHAANQTAVAAVGGIETVLAALRTHPSVEAVQIGGFLALSSLVTNHSLNFCAVANMGAPVLARIACGRFGAGTGAHLVAFNLRKTFGLER